MSQLCDQIRKAETFPGSFAGTEVVSMDHVGQIFGLNGVRMSTPDLSNYVVAGYSPEGAYRWYVSGEDWWMVKDVPVPSRSGRLSGTNHYVIRNYKGKTLGSTDFVKKGGGHAFLSAHLDKAEIRASIGPSIGRRWSEGSIADTLQTMTDVRQTQSASGIEIEGRYKGSPLHLTVAPQYGYLVTSLLRHSGSERIGYTITKVKRVGPGWMPAVVDLLSGVYENGRLTSGSSGHAEFSGFEPHGTPSAEEAPPIPAGSILGGDDNRLYRMSSDGTLVDYGRAGYHPGTSLAWGDLFVLSGAGLLLGALSWLVFRKRRSNPSPLRGRGGRG